MRIASYLAVSLGVLTGLGLFTFHYAEGFSYFSQDPKACANCHIMNDNYDSWSKSSHHAAALCVDCHMPQNIVEKLIAKADNGYRHSKAFTLQNFHQPIMIIPRNAEILQNNCVRCHQTLVGDLHGNGMEQSSIRCIQCHVHVGHGSQR